MLALKSIVQVLFVGFVILLCQGSLAKKIQRPVSLIAVSRTLSIRSIDHFRSAMAQMLELRSLGDCLVTPAQLFGAAVSVDVFAADAGPVGKLEKTTEIESV